MKRKSEGLSPGKENIPTPARKRTKKGLEEDKSQIKMDLFIKKETNWKNIYKQYKENQEQAVTKLENILKETKMTKENDLDLLKIIEYCTLEFSWDVDKGAVLASLKQHCLYEKAVACVSNRLQKMTKTVKGMASSVFCGIVFLSRGVVDIKNLVKCLTKTNPKMNIDKIMEKLYWLAALLYSRREHTYIKRLHFNICYYLNQKEHLRAHGNIRKKQSFHPTKEQEEILNHPLGSNDVVKVEAFAGTGKTRTLIEYAKKKSELKFLYLAFNNTNINEAKKRFPKNVTCKTFHSLAQRKRKPYEEMNKRTYNKLTLPVDTSEQDHFVNKMVSETLLNFLVSADDKISKEHAPTNYKNENGQTVQTQEHMFTDVLEKANLRWENMKSLNETESYIDKMTPDGYFKLWQLSNPILDNCNAIFVDDVTNCTPAMIKVVLSQQCGKIFVGDPNLHIYTFRGAKNNLSTIPSTHNFNLTQIIRFGSKIAFAATAILKHTKKMEDQSVVGINNTVGFIRIFPRSSSSSRNARGHVLESKAILCRTNKKIFDEAVRLTKKTKEGTQPTINIIGGLGTYGLTDIHDIWRLRNGGKELQAIKDKYINTWKAKGFYALKDCARRTENKKLLWKIEIVEEYSNRIPELVQRISNCYTCIKQKTDYFISTLHKAKGMEFDTVIIPDEYNNIETELKQWKMLQTPNEDVQPADAEGRDDTTETIQPEDEDEEMDQMEETIQSGDENEEIDEAEDLPEQDEWSLLYVAVTCAKKNLVLPKCMKTILSLSGEHFLRPMWTSKILKGGPVMCKQCRKPLCKDTILTMKKMPIVFSDGKEDAGGYFCIACVEPLVGPLISLIASPECEINATQ